MLDLHFSINNNFVILLQSDTPFTFTGEDLLLLKGHVPGIELLNEPPSKIDFVLEHIQSSEKSVLEEVNKVTIKDEWSERLPDDITHLLYGISRKLYLSANQYPVHGACLELSGKNMLIVGHSGAGKTSVTLELLKNNKVELFSGNKTVVDFNNNHFEAVAGTPTITVRKSDMKLFSEIEKEQEHERWERNTFLLPQHRYTENDSVAIDTITIVKLTSYTESCDQLAHPSSLHTLYPYFMDLVNADIILADFGRVFSSDTAIESKEALVQALSIVSDSTPVFSITGTTSYVATTLKSI